MASCARSVKAASVALVLLVRGLVEKVVQQALRQKVAVKRAAPEETYAKLDRHAEAAMDEGSEGKKGLMGSLKSLLSKKK